MICVFLPLCPRQVEDNVTVILLSEIVWDKFRPNTGCFEPLLLHFPDYSKGIIVHALAHATSASVMNKLPPRCIIMTCTWRMRCEICTCDFVLTLQAAIVEERCIIKHHCIKSALYRGWIVVYDMWDQTLLFIIPQCHWCSVCVCVFMYLKVSSHMHVCPWHKQNEDKGFGATNYMYYYYCCFCVHVLFWVFVKYPVCRI